MLIADSHLDLGMNAVLWNRDLRRAISEIRKAEQGMVGLGRAHGTVSLPELRKAKVFLFCGTTVARLGKGPSELAVSGSFSAQDICYAIARGQVAYYEQLERDGWLRFIRTSDALHAHVSEWVNMPETAPLGMILSMEGADPIMTPSSLDEWWELGVRVISLSHYGVGKYAYGTDTEGGLREGGRELLMRMRELGIILDLTHLADQAFWEALAVFDGPVLASHNNCRALVPHQRQFEDDQIRAIVERKGVIGVVMDDWMLVPGWRRGDPSMVRPPLSVVADHIDHICQLAGSADHVAIGSDLDGGYGTEQTPAEIDTIADLQRLPDVLKARGYASSDVEKIMWRNWVDCFTRTLPPEG